MNCIPSILPILVNAVIEHYLLGQRFVLHSVFFMGISKYCYNFQTRKVFTMYVALVITVIKHYLVTLVTRACSDTVLTTGLFCMVFSLWPHQNISTQE